MAECPPLAPPKPILITAKNVNMTLLSTYTRTPGTIVRLSCLGAPTYTLNGPETVKCLSNGSWSPTPPVCQKSSSVSNSGGMNSISTTPQNTIAVTEPDIRMLPIIVVLSLFALLCIFSIVLVAIAYTNWKRKPKKTPTETSSIDRISQHRTAYPTFRSSHQSLFSGPFSDWDSASVDRGHGAENRAFDNNDYLYNGSTVTAVSRENTRPSRSWYCNYPFKPNRTYETRDL